MSSKDTEKTKNSIVVIGARVNNLKNVDVTIPRNSLTVITGLSGSGKSSLAFDTIYAEGQRRYIETFSAYVRNFLGGMQRPDVDKITGLSPVISIEQKTTNKNPRSTVGTVTEIYDFLRLLYARTATAYSDATGEKMVKYTEDQILDLILSQFAGRKVFILAPLVKNRKGHYRELFENVLRKGYLHVRVDGEIKEVSSGMKLDRYRNHDIEVVVDRLSANPKDSDRLVSSVATAMRLGDGVMMVLDKESGTVRHYSRRLMCPTTGNSYRDPAPGNFSFNSPQGACPCCNGLGYVSLIDEDKLMPDRSLSVHDGGLAPLGKFRKTMIFWQLSALLEQFGCDIHTPISELPHEAIHQIVYGSQNRLRIPAAVIGQNNDFYTNYEGLARYIRQLLETEQTSSAQKWAESFDSVCECPECHGQRLNSEALHFRIGDMNIAQLSSLDIQELYDWMGHVNDYLTGMQRRIAEEIVKEIRTRLSFLLDVGLDYLSLNRATMTLSGGESQRIRLATQIGAKLVNVLYILDEPSIGLHQRDNDRLIKALKTLRDSGNTVIVVEHDRDMMLNADYIVDMGPLAGRKGGEVIFQGTPEELMKTDTLTARSLREDPLKAKAVDGEGDSNTQPSCMAEAATALLTVRGCRGNNLRNVDVTLPLGRLICVTGVSGSGKSSFVNDTLCPILSQKFYHSLRPPLEYDSVEGIENLNKVVTVDQSPIGRTPRSNPATYTGVFSDIRNIFSVLPEAQVRGYKPGRFSFNIAGGRCETCGGNGYKTIEMNFLPDVFVPCETCHGKRYNRETLEVRFKGKSIADVLDMTINQAVEFFENQPVILNKIKVLQEVGLGYIKLGQSSTTLSGGESQRVKLATELSKRDTGKTMYILDEPTTGLHYEDIKALMVVLRSLVDKGNTVVVIEHNTDVICQADYIIDMGPEGGSRGGQIVAQGTLSQIKEAKRGYTYKWL
ncbi:MAG: excinuclease ABC subunit UvrA [Bacteroidaceae bacterium]|nr:excinuclease ABC subunit UvrA [Bacteroidaceae bacterium]